MKIIKNIVVALTLFFTLTPLSAKLMKKKEGTQVQPTQVQPRPVIAPELPRIQPVVVPVPQARQQVPIIPMQPVRRVEMMYHLVPTDAQTLRQYDLCPLFGEGGGLYPVFNPAARTSSGAIVARFEYEYVNQNAPCIKSLGRFGNWNRTLIQLKSLDQFELSNVTGLDPALCAGHSLNNGRLIRDYVLTGNRQDLRDLHDLNKSANFLLDLNIGAWLNVEVVKEKIIGLRKELGIDGVDVSAVSTVSLFDSNLDKKFGFATFSQDEFTYVQKLKQNIIQGLQKDNYVHVMIIGNEETVEEALGHYFCFVIAKVGNEVQYIVLDTSPTAYHLQAGSHALDRLMFVIQNIEQGYSLINVTNLRIKFLEEEK